MPSTRNIIISLIPAAVVTGVILYLAGQSPGSAMVREFPLPAKPGHFIGYFTLTAAVYWGLQQRRLLGVPWAKAAPGSFLWALQVAFLDEFVQSYTPGRMGSVYDVFLDAAGAAAALLLLLALSHRQPRRPSNSKNKLTRGQAPG